LVVYPERMQETLDASLGLVYSQRVLLALVDSGLTREEAYAVVQDNAMRAWDEGTPLRELLASDDRATAHLSADDLEGLFAPRWHTRHLADVMARVEAL
ncbi:MAG: adenylosuccinate lyase, partial [Miltoncostaeaceae bacterium]